MKLKKLQIKKYKNLIDFTVDFEPGKGLSILIGNNGLGKSNVLEAISGIFVNAYSAKAIHKFVYSLTYDYFLLSCGLLFASIPYKKYDCLALYHAVIFKFGIHIV